MDTQIMFHIYDCVDGKCKVMDITNIISFIENRLSKGAGSELITFMLKKAESISQNSFIDSADTQLSFNNIPEISTLLFVIRDICHRFFEAKMSTANSITWKHVANIDSLIDKIHQDLVMINRQNGVLS